jgi:CDP-glycerol glycerophosphotransferase
VDWRTRLGAIETSGRVVLSEDGDATPLLAASDLMVTDHSSIGFEFLLLDRPLIVFHAPDLERVARINPERIAALRSAARVVHDASEVGAAANEERGQAHRLSAARAAVAAPLFHEPGTATSRALQVVYDLLELPTAHVQDAGTPHAASPGTAMPRS